MTNTPAGWYPQPDGQQRYWDGQQWTEHFAPGTGDGQSAGEGAAAAVDASGPTRDRPWFKKKRYLIPGGVVALIILGSALNGAGADESPTSVAVGTTEASTSR